MVQSFKKGNYQSVSTLSNPGEDDHCIIEASEKPVANHFHAPFPRLFLLQLFFLGGDHCSLARPEINILIV